MRTLLARIVGASVARPWATLALALALTLAAGLVAAGRFAMTTDTAELLSPTVAWRVQERAAEAAFPQLADVMAIVVDGTTPELAEDGAARLASRLGADRAHFRRVARPDAGPFFAREGLLFGSVAEVKETAARLIEAQALLGPLAADPSLRGVAGALDTVVQGAAAGQTSLDRLRPAMQALATYAEAVNAGRPVFFSWQRLFSGGGALAPPTRRVILARPLLDHAALMPGEQASAALDRATRALGLSPTTGVTVRLTGEVPLADEEFATLQENIGAVGAVMLCAMLLTLWLATRSLKLVAAIVLTIVAGLVVTTAVGLLAVGRLNLISIAFIPLFVGLGIDFAIQLSVRFNAERADGLAPPDAVRAAAEALGPSLLLAAAAVTLGFGAFLPTAYVGIAELGVIAGLGMIVALLFAATMLPALLVLLRPGAPGHEPGFARLAGADRLLAEKRRIVLWAFAVALVLSIVSLWWVRFDFNPLHLRDPEAPAMRTLADLQRDPDRTADTIDVLAPDHAAALALKAKLEALPEVRQVVSLDSFVPADQPAKLAALGDAATLLDLTLNPFDVAPVPSDAELQQALRTTAAGLTKAAVGPAGGEARRLAAAFERLADGPPARRARANAGLARPLGTMLDQLRLALQAQPVTLGTLPPDLARDWRAPDGRERLQLFPRGDKDNRDLARFRDAVARVTPAISGLPVATQAAGRTVARAFVQAGVIAFVLVSLLLLAVLRDLKEVAFTLAPVILSIFLTLGTCVVIGQPINFANIIAFPLLFGVGVAFHIYFVMAWRAGATGLLQSSLARAVLFSAMATGTAFGSLWLSRHPGTASMGKILMLSLVWTLICALVFEPALLGPPRKRRGSPHRQSSRHKAGMTVGFNAASQPDRPGDR